MWLAGFGFFAYCCLRAFLGVIGTSQRVLDRTLIFPPRRAERRERSERREAPKREE